MKEFSKIRYNRFNAHYQLAHSYCRMIIEQFFFSNISGDFQCFSVLLNSWDIYERFLRKSWIRILKDHWKSIQPHNLPFFAEKLSDAQVIFISIFDFT